MSNGVKILLDKIIFCCRILMESDMIKRISGILCSFVKPIILLVVTSIFLSSLCKRKPDENYLEPINVSNNSGRSENPSIAVDSRNTVHLVWNDDTPGNEEIFYTHKSTGGIWLTPTSITDTQAFSRFPCIVVDRNNTVHLAWQQSVGAGWKILYTYKDTGNIWAVPETISVYGLSLRPVLAVDNDLGLHLFWMEGFSGEDCRYHYAYKPYGGQWQIRYLFTTVIAQYEMKVDSRNGVHVVLDPHSEIYYVEKRTDGIWSDTVRISHSPTDWQLSMSPSLETESDGSLDIVWSENDTTMLGIAYIKKTSEGQWLSIIAPYKTEDWRNYWGCPFPKVRKGRTGKLYVVWLSAKVGYGVKVGEEWQRAKTLVEKTGGFEPAMAIDYQEYIHFAWPNSDSLTGWQRDIYYIEFKP